AGERTEPAVEPETLEEAAVTPVATRPFVLGYRDPVTGAELANFGRRAGALVLDTAFLGVLFIGVPVALGAPVLLVAASFLGPSLYRWLMIGAKGQTLGKMALGIQVRRSEDAGRVSYSRALGREVAEQLLGVFVFPAIFSYLRPLWNPRRQTWHDSWAETIAVRI
ncbi:MAG: RDD family protein, partial [Thermoleophilia bacterium]|nr:RDD family protein [Thermoleophilia bacterium]